ncbi:hypothetical protein ES704_01959 [subsurface metagenome]|jgi:glycerol-3-phosphate cytidylyltransferase-like family protein
MNEQEQQESAGAEALAMAEESNALGEQDELLLTEKEVKHELYLSREAREFIRGDDFEENCVWRGAIAQLAKAKQHYEQTNTIIVGGGHPEERIPLYKPKQKRLDRPELREKILGGLLGAYSLLDNISEPTDQQKEWMEKETNQILALIPDIEEAKKQEQSRHLASLRLAVKQERERMLKEVDGIISWGDYEELADGTKVRDGHIMSEPWQALKEEK